MKLKSILLFSDNYVPEMNANARIFSELAELWVQMGCEVSVITSHPNFPRGIIYPGYRNNWLTKEEINEVKVHRVKTYVHPNKGFIRRSFDFLSFGISGFIFGLFRGKGEIIIGVTPQFFCAFFACLLAVIRKKPFLLVLCDLWPDSIVANQLMKKNILYRVIKRLELWMYRQASSIAVLSEHFKHYLMQLQIPEGQIFLSIAAPSAAFYPREKCQQLIQTYALSTKFIVGYLGTLGISQGLDDILKVVDELHAHNAITFMMVGDGVKRHELHHQALTRTNLVVDGPVPGEKMPEYWSILDIALVSLADTPTNKTVLPSKILESLAMGIPVILYAPEGEASRFMGVLNVGWFVPVGELTALTNLITYLAQSPKSVEEQKQQALKAAAKFSREQQARELLERMDLLNGWNEHGTL
ncbi:MAG: glycosyltransferase family 4 protein [Legionella sp.]|nr:glycosyltransferase family 4 protein [Legionella sp.]